MKQAGFLTIDFLFALILCLGLGTVMMTMAFTLSVVEGIQYMTFAGSRAAYASHLTVQDQTSLGMAKYEQLLRTPGLINVFKKQWFTFNGKVGNFSSDYKPDVRPNKFFGMIIDIHVKILNFFIPLVGETAPEGGFQSTTGPQSGFPARITSFLGRETSVQECELFFKSRPAWISDLDSSYRQVKIDQNLEVGDDNGC